MNPPDALIILIGDEQRLSIRIDNDSPGVVESRDRPWAVGKTRVETAVKKNGTRHNPIRRHG